QICAWMLARCRGGRTFGRARLAMATAKGTCLRCGSPVSPYFDCYLIVIFLGPVGDASCRRRPCARPPDCRRRLTYWRHDESRLGPARTCAAEKKKFHGWGMAAVVFRCCLQCGLWRIALATTAQS